MPAVPGDMGTHTPQRLAIALTRDDGGPIDELESALPTNERSAASVHCGGRRRHFALGRLAAHAAVDRVGAAEPGIWIGTALCGAPDLHGSDGNIGLAIAHSGMLAIGCAWTNDHQRPRRVGVDLERVRETAIAHSGYAFSRRERRLLLGAGVDASRAGLLGWVAKEAAWKALRFPADVGPDAIELRSFDTRRAVVVPRCDRNGGTVDRYSALTVRLGELSGPDGAYVLGLAVCAEQNRSTSPSHGDGIDD
jgi:4'-phosphopantetheinyl transferase EntD